MTTGLELVQWALWWMAEQRRQYILNMRKTLYYIQRAFLVALPPDYGFPQLPGGFTMHYDLTKLRHWKDEISTWSDYASNTD